MLRPVLQRIITYFEAYLARGIRDGAHGMQSLGVSTSGEGAIAPRNGRSTSGPSEWTATFEGFTGDQIYVEFNELAVVLPHK